MQLTSLKRYLYGRIARESENLATLEQRAHAESVSDSIMSTVYRIMDHIDDVMIPLVKLGKYPQTNPNLDALTQYAEVMEDT